MSDYSAIRQKLAAIEHERWADWQKWCHQVIRENDQQGRSVEDVLERWDRQIQTPYVQLSDAEKASDMEQVDRYWPLIEELIAKAEVAGRIDELERTRYDSANLSLMGKTEWTTFERRLFERITRLELRGDDRG